MLLKLSLYRVSVATQLHFESVSNGNMISVPPPTVTVSTNPPGIIAVGSSVTLTCTVELSSSVDVPVTVNTVWTGPDNFNEMAQQMGSTTTYTSTAMVSSFGRNQSGNYTCTANVRPKPTSTHLNTSGESLQSAIVIMAGVLYSLS